MDFLANLPIEVQALSKYIETVIGVKVSYEPWEQRKGMNVAFREQYDTLLMDLLGETFLLMIDKSGPDDLSVGQIAKHVQNVVNRFSLLPIYVAASIVPIKRIRLIEKGIQFIVPENQMFLPAVGIDLREQYKQRMSASKKLSPSAQALLFKMMNEGWDTTFVTSRASIVKSLEYSEMTVSRIVRELSQYGVLRSGNGTPVVIEHPPTQVWEKILPKVRNPVSRVLWLESLPRGAEHSFLIAGESALARQTMLAEPRVKVYAARGETVPRIKTHATYDNNPDFGMWANDLETIHLHTVPSSEAYCAVEIWSYAPLPSKTAPDCIDPFSLYASLMHETDPRINMALTELIESALPHQGGKPWL